MKHVKNYKLFENEMHLSENQKKFLDHYANGRWSVDPSTGLVDIAGDFDCSRGYLDDFLGIRFGFVKGSFFCSDKNLTSLEGAPQEVGGSFGCSYNKLTSLKGAPQEVGESFYCNENSLTSLKGAPEKVGGGFSCKDNPLTSLEGAPQKIHNSFFCDEFTILGGEWNPSGWLKILREGSDYAKKLILTLPFFEPGYLQNEINKNPVKWAYELKDIWNSEYFRSIRDKLDVPKDFIEDAGLYGDLTSIGLDI